MTDAKPMSEEEIEHFRRTMCDSDPPGLKRLLSTLDQARRERDEWKRCPLCVGQPHPSGKPCVCGGTNNAMNSHTGILVEYHAAEARALSAEKERDALRNDLADARTLLASPECFGNGPEWQEQVRKFLDTAHSPSHEFLAIIEERTRERDEAEVALELSIHGQIQIAEELVKIMECFPEEPRFVVTLPEIRKSIAALKEFKRPDRKALITCTRCFQEFALACYAAGEVGMVDALTHLLDTGALTKVADETAAIAKEGVDPKAVKGGFLAGAITVIEAARATAARPAAEALLLEKMRQPRPCPHCPGDGKTCAPRHRYPS